MMSTLLRKRPIMVIDSESYVPPEEYRVDMDACVKVWADHNMFSEEERTWMMKVHAKSGLGRNSTYLPPAIHPQYCKDKPKTDLASAYKECKMAVCGAVEGLLAKTGMQPKDVDILVTTCSIYCPTPSMASMVVNHFKMRNNVQSYHLGGMGCANGVVGINMVQDLLNAYPNSNAIFVCNETTTPALYSGHDKHRMVTNLLFRMGASATLLSNKRSWGDRAKYELITAHRVHLGQSEEAYRAIRFQPDDEGVNGIYLGKNVVSEASLALSKALWQVAPKLLTPGQKAEFAANWVVRKLFGPDAAPRYMPRLSVPIQHFLIHSGGARVLEGIGKALQLEEYDLEPSRMVLHDYGNVSSSSTWYTLGFIESVRGVKEGDQVLQVGVGSGIKCGLNVWKALRDVDDVHEAWAHRVPEDRMIQLSSPMLDGSFGAFHAALRILFMLVMGIAMGLLMLSQQYSASALPLPEKEGGEL